MAMNLPLPPIVFIITFLLLLFSPVSSLDQQHYSSLAPQGMLFQDKARLGSRPPSCHNKCNQCHPCMAVQVPSHDRVRSGSRKETTMDFSDSSPTYAGNRHSNYKPLGWKCRCGGHFYKP